MLVGGDGVLPQAHHRVNVRRHVTRMRRGGRQLAVAARGDDALVRQRRVIVTVDQKVHHTGVFRVFQQQRFKDLRRLLLLPVPHIILGRGGLQVERIKHPGFVIIGILFRQFQRGLGVAREAHVDRRLVVVAVVSGERFDPVTLALRFCTDRLRLLQSLPRGLRILGLRRRRQRIAEVIQRYAPVRHRAIRIILQHRIKRFARFAKPVRVQLGHAGLELLLHLGRTGGGERQFAELIRGFVCKRGCAQT